MKTKFASSIASDNSSQRNFRTRFSTLAETIRKPLAITVVALGLVAAAGTFKEAKAIDDCRSGFTTPASKNTEANSPHDYTPFIFSGILVLLSGAVFAAGAFLGSVAGDQSQDKKRK